MVSESSRGDILDDFPSLTALQMNSDADVWLMQCWTPRHHHRWHPPFLLVTVFMPATRIYYWDQLPSITNLQWWGISVAIIGNFVCNIKPVVTVVQSIRNSNAAIDSEFARPAEYCTIETTIQIKIYVGSVRPFRSQRMRVRKAYPENPCTSWLWSFNRSP